MTGPSIPDGHRDVVPLREATRAWFEVSLQTFGGPAGQIAIMQHKIVDEKRWISQKRFLHALNYCMLLPGPEAQQLSIYLGWLLNGRRGGLIAGTLFVLPGVVALLALSVLYVAAGDTSIVEGLFLGLAPAVIAIIIQAVYRLAQRTMHHGALVAIAVASFVALTFFGIRFPFVILGAAVVGWILSRRIPALRQLAGHTTENGPTALVDDDSLHRETPSKSRSVKLLALGLVLWFAPLLAAVWLLSPDHVFIEQGIFFSGAALVTFGGAYAVLTYVAQQAIEVGWLLPGEMARGLALAETTPGPLIMVVQFVAFVGAYRAPGPLDPWVAAVLASLLVIWVTFVPSFLFVLLGAPYIERLRNNQHLTAMLTGITAAVVGVIANLGVFFTLHNLFDQNRPLTWGPLQLDIPILTTWDPIACALTGLALALIFWRGWTPLRTLGACALIGLAIGILTH